MVLWWYMKPRQQFWEIRTRTFYNRRGQRHPLLTVWRTYSKQREREVQFLEFLSFCWAESLNYSNIWSNIQYMKIVWKLSQSIDNRVPTSLLKTKIPRKRTVVRFGDFLQWRKWPTDKIDSNILRHERIIRSPGTSGRNTHSLQTRFFVFSASLVTNFVFFALQNRHILCFLRDA